jgi:hypothetical protein
LEHLKTLLEALWGKDHPDIQKQRHRWAKRLLKDGVEKIIRQALLWSGGKARQQGVNKALGKAGYFIGSGVGKPAARRSSERAANNPACFGHNRALKTSWPCVASKAAANGTPFG